LYSSQKLAVEAAIKGEFVRPSERRRQQMLLESQGSGGYGNGDPSSVPYRSGSMDGRPGGYGGGRGGGGYNREGGGGYRGGSGGYDSREGGYGGGDRRGGYGGGWIIAVCRWRHGSSVFRYCGVVLHEFSIAAVVHTKYESLSYVLLHTSCCCLRWLWRL
jgi:hypothetical protein